MRRIPLVSVAVLSLALAASAFAVRAERQPILAGYSPIVVHQFADGGDYLGNEGSPILADGGDYLGNEGSPILARQVADGGDYVEPIRVADGGDYVEPIQVADGGDYVGTNA
jgi:hypothetical protein